MLFITGKRTPKKKCPIECKHCEAFKGDATNVETTAVLTVSEQKLHQTRCEKNRKENLIVHWIEHTIFQEISKIPDKYEKNGWNEDIFFSISEYCWRTDKL